MMISISTNCPLCGTESTVFVEKEDMDKWDEGALVQNAFPYLTAGEREVLISGVCTPCWDRSFGEE